MTWAYFVLDSLGSVAVVADQGGNVTQRLSYDAWGKQRNANGTDASCGSISPSTSRGFTNQEQVSGGCTVNLNARLYDPSIGKFMAADSVVDDPYAPNAFNRYAYLLNNPLSFTDPTGHSIFGSIFGAILDIAVFFVAPELEGYTLFGDSGLLASAASFNLTSIGILAANGAIGGGLSAGVSGGSVLKGAFLGALQGGLSGYTGGLLAQEATSEGMAEAVGISASEAESTVSILGSNTADSIVANGLVGGIVSAAGDGPFGSGFLAAGVGSLAGPIGIAGGHFSTGNLVASAALGGVGSVLGGGKFANGAVTGAFSYAAGANYANDNEQEQGAIRWRPEAGTDQTWQRLQAIPRSAQRSTTLGQRRIRTIR